MTTGILIFILSTFLHAQVNFSANAERTKLAVGEQGIIVATLICNKNPGSITMPTVSSNDAFTVLNSGRQGPSSFSSIEIINGVAKQKNEVHYQFIYTISPKKSGSFEFPSLSIIIDGTEYTTKSISFSATSESVKNQDVRVSLVLSKQNLHVGEQATLVLKVAQRGQSSVDVRNGFSPALEKLEKSFGKAFSLSRLFTTQVTTSQERIDGEMHNVFSLKYVIFALNEGSFSIPSVPFEYQEIRKAQRRRMDPFFDDFFDNDFFGGGVQAVAKTAFSNALSIQVKALPPAPAGFAGAVGSFSINASVEPKEVPAGEAVTLKISVKGNTRPANIGEIVLPKLDNCETFSPEKQTFTDTTASGISGRKNYKYMLIPRNEGTLAIPSINFTYFDPSSGTFKTAITEPLSVNVTASKGGRKEVTRYMSQEEIQQVGQDIRYIKTSAQIKNQSEYPYRNPIFFLLYSLPFIIFFMALIYRYQAAHREKNSALHTRQKALSNALKQIGSIKKQGSQLSQSVFLGKVASVIETYISQKFNFPATGRTLEELKEELLKCNADEKVVNELAVFIEHLDRYRFGGVKFDESTRTSTLEKSIKFLENLQKGTKKDKVPVAQTVSILAIVLSGFFIPAISAPIDQWFNQANKFYDNQNYDSAFHYYQQIVNSGVSNSTVYYNLGNTCYRMKQTGLARLYFEKAAKLSPDDQDIRGNIRFITSVITDKVTGPERTLIESVLWKLHVLLPLSTQLWTLFILLLAISVLISATLYIRGNIRLWLIYLSVLFTLITIAIGISAGIKIHDAEKITYAIVLTQSIDTKNEPDGNKVLFTIHEGTKILIRKTDEGWSLVSLPNGLSGWVKNSDIGKI